MSKNSLQKFWNYLTIPKVKSQNIYKNYIGSYQTKHFNTPKLLSNEGHIFKERIGKCPKNSLQNYLSTNSLRKISNNSENWYIFQILPNLLVTLSLIYQVFHDPQV